MAIVNSMVTTIQLPVDLKKELDSLKSDSNMTYADVLKRLVENEKKRRNELLLEDYGSKYGETSVSEVKEWKATEKDWD